MSLSRWMARGLVHKSTGILIISTWTGLQLVGMSTASRVGAKELRAYPLDPVVNTYFWTGFFSRMIDIRRTSTVCLEVSRTLRFWLACYLREIWSGRRRWKPLKQERISTKVVISTCSTSAKAILVQKPLKLNATGIAHLLTLRLTMAAALGPAYEWLMCSVIKEKMKSHRRSISLDRTAKTKLSAVNNRYCESTTICGISRAWEEKHIGERLTRMVHVVVSNCGCNYMQSRRSTKAVTTINYIPIG